MLYALRRLISLGARRFQLSLEPGSRPRDAHDLKRLLVRLGLQEHYRIHLTQNRTVVVSYADDVLRLHRGYLDAPDNVLEAVVRFVQPQSRRERTEARRELLAFKLPSHPRHSQPIRRPPERTHPRDLGLARALAREHAEQNARKFDGQLGNVAIRVSRRMKSRFGHYTWRGQDGHAAELVVSRRHMRRDAWEEVVHTLLHEMVHQWQDEMGLKVDHGREFRRKARAVGISPLARRDVA